MNLNEGLTSPGQENEEICRKFSAMTQDKKLDLLFMNLLEARGEVRDLRMQISKLESTNEALVKENVGLKERMSILEGKNEYLENQSRRNNLVFRGMKENDKEKWEDCKSNVSNVIREVLGYVDLKDEDIERAHRVNSKASPRPIVVKFKSFAVREKVFERKKKLIGSDIVILEDFAYQTIQDRQILVSRMKEEREDGNYAIVSFNKLIVENEEFKRTFKYDRQQERIVEINKVAIRKKDGKRKTSSPLSEDQCRDRQRWKLQEEE